MIEDKPFIPFLLQRSTGKVVMKNPVTGLIEYTSIAALNVYDASGMPGGWLKASLTFERNLKYWGLTRAYSDPLTFVKEHRDTIAELYYGGNGIETELDLLILQYNSQPQPGEPTYMGYCRMALDFPNIVDVADQGIELTMIDAGLPQLLKAFENVKFPFPCDGSITQNKKVLLDGMLLQDTLSYAMLNAQALVQGTVAVPLFYQGNSGDNVGVITNSPDLEHYTDYIQLSNSTNFLFQSAAPIRVKVSGTINMNVTSNYGLGGEVPFTALSLILVTSANNSVNLMPNQQGAAGPVSPAVHITITGPQSITFSGEIDLAANESLFLLLITDSVLTVTNIVSGSLQLDINSAFPATRAWGITAWDLWGLIVERIIVASSTTNQVYNYKADSQLLQDSLNMVLTPGDALRASGNPNYQKYFQAFQINAANPGSNIITAFGPVLKTSLYEFFQFCNVVLFAALGNQQLPGEGESLFIETMNYVLNKTGNQVDTGEIANFKISFPTEFNYTEIEIGYPVRTTDKKAGKYDWNTTGTWYTPFKSMPSKKLSLICPYIASAYLVEQLRAGLDSTSTTQNQSDNDVFILNADPTKVSNDYQTQVFNSLARDINNPNNSNIRLTPNILYQGIPTNQNNGSFFSVNNDPSIFIFSYGGFSASKLITFKYNGTFTGNIANTLTGTPDDTVTIKFYINGVVVYTRTWSATGAIDTITDTFTNTLTFNEGDCVYATATTSNTGTAQITTSIDVGVAGEYWHVDSAGIITVIAGSPSAMLAMPNVVAPTGVNGPILSYSFQYFLFNNMLMNSAFTTAIDFSAILMNQNGGQTVTIFLYKNGVKIKGFTFTAINGTFVTPSVENFVMESDVIVNYGDIYFAVASTENLNSQITYFEWQWTAVGITVNALKRVNYDVMTGIPNVAIDPVSGLVRTDIAGAPFNLEDLTPRRLLEKWSAFFRAIWGNQLGGSLIFGTLTKNQNLATTYQGKTYTENSNYPIGQMNAALFLPLKFEFDTAVPIRFSDLFTRVAGAHINSTFNGVALGSFPWKVSQQAAINEKQQWLTMASTATDPHDLIDLNITGINNLVMATASIFPAFSNSLQFVAQVQNLDPRYQTLDFNNTLYCQQIGRWVNQNGYANPWQIGEKIPLQFITNGLTPVTAQVYQLGTNLPVGALITFTPKDSSAVQSPNLLFEGLIDTTDLPEDNYYIVVNAGGNAGAYIVSEPISVQTVAYDTILFEYSNSYNRQTMIFDTGFTGAFRVLGFIDNTLQPKYVGANYIDQQQDITKLGFIPYETRTLYIVGADGMPDYVIKKIARILGLDTVDIDGIGYTLDEGAEWEKTTWKGNPKKYWKTTIRPSKNIDGIAVSASGVSDTNVIISVDSNLFGPNGQNLGGQNPNITNLEISA